MTRVLVCGGREYNRVEMVNLGLDRLDGEVGITCIIHGEATGADTLAGEWADAIGRDVEPYPIEPGESGYDRNFRMLHASIPHIVVHFPGGNGTRHMVAISNYYKYEVIAGMDLVLGAAFAAKQGSLAF